MNSPARDEFDGLPENLSRQGAHRARPSPARRLLPLLVVLVLVVAVVVGTSWWIDSGGAGDVVDELEGSAGLAGSLLVPR